MKVNVSQESQWQQSLSEGVGAKQISFRQRWLDLGQERRLPRAGRLHSLMRLMWELSKLTSCGRLPSQRKWHPTEDSASLLLLLLLLPHLRNNSP